MSKGINASEIARRRMFVKDLAEHNDPELLDGIVGERAIEDTRNKQKGSNGMNMEKALEELDPRVRMTSELLYLTERSGRTSYEEEFERRLGMLGLSDESIGETKRKELSIIKKERGPFSDRQRPWATRSYITTGLGPENLWNPKDMTLSELISVVDDALVASWRNNELIDKGAMNAIEEIKSGKYDTELYRRTMKELDWTEKQSDVYLINERHIPLVLKYNKDPVYTPTADEACWTEKAADLESY